MLACCRSPTDRAGEGAACSLEGGLVGGSLDLDQLRKLAGPGRGTESVAWASSASSLGSSTDVVRRQPCQGADATPTAGHSTAEGTAGSTEF